jgi:hypothetical protein
MRFLLPHERWVVGWMLKRQRTHRTSAVVTMEQNYGPDGMIWMDASLANAQYVGVLGVAVFVIVFAHPTRTSAIAGYLLVVVFLLLVLCIVRLLQSFRAGRRFRREHQ